MLTRRQLLIAGRAAGTAAQLPRTARAAPLQLRAMPLNHTVLPGKLTHGPMGYGEGPPPILRLAPGQRGDLALVMPPTGEVTLHMTLDGKTHPLQHSLADLAPLPPNPAAEPDLTTAKIIDFTLGWPPEGKPGVDDPCGDSPDPGDWVLHCHVIEHQKTGLAAYVRVA